MCSSEGGYGDATFTSPEKSTTSKSRDHIRLLERCMEEWKNANIEELLHERRDIQNRLPKLKWSSKITDGQLAECT